MLGHERLRAWQKGHELTLGVYRLTRNWPPDERYGLTSQIRRATVSVPANLAEGAAKRGSREFRRYVDIALGSLAEVAYLLALARDLGMLSAEDWEFLDDIRRQTGAMTWRLARSLDPKPA